ncbi:MAG TPA: APC family permease [Ktedonobacteraceae bacterium]|nr:APC family permease [Ktedonobacteraceae bacterium]
MAIKIRTSTYIPHASHTLLSETYVPRAMPRILSTFDMTAAFVIALFLMPSAVITAASGGIGLVYLVVGCLVFFIPCTLITAQLGALLPHEGSLYNWTHRALGPFWSFFVGFCFWLSGVMAVVTALNGEITMMQGLNAAWLTKPWQQGVVMLAMLAFVGLLATQRSRRIHNLFNAGFILIMLAVLLVALASVVWLASGHAAMISFHHISSWLPGAGTFPVFGLITLNYIGASGPLNLAGELRREQAVIRHLRWGLPLVFACYFVTALAMLIVHGEAAIAGAAIAPFDVITMVSGVLGKFVSNIVVICIMTELLLAALFYVHISARLLMTASIDQRIPVGLARLNRARAPRNAVIAQTLASALLILIIFILAPTIAWFGTPMNLAAIFFSVNLAALTMIWALATAFFFVDIVFLYLRSPKEFCRRRLFPMWIIWSSAAVGFIACMVTIFDALFNSWVANLMSNQAWWEAVGGLAFACLVVTAVCSMLANGEARWEAFSE